MQTWEVTSDELAVAALGYDEDYPTRQQETLSAIYIRNLYKQNGKGLLVETGDVAASTAELNTALSAVTLPVKYASWLPAILSLACDVIALTSTSSILLREIGIRAIDRLIDHTIRVIFDNLFSQEAPPGENSGEIPAEIALLTEELKNFKEIYGGTSCEIYDDTKGKIYSMTVGGLEVGG